jgi:hypothetical protein
LRARTQRDAPGDTVQPARERAPLSDGSGFAHEHKESRLKGVLGIVKIAEDSPANGKDHRTVALHQKPERRLLPRSTETLQQFPVIQVPAAFYRTELAQQVTKCSLRHVPDPWSEVISINIVQADGRLCGRPYEGAEKIGGRVE